MMQTAMPQPDTNPRIRGALVCIDIWDKVDNRILHFGLGDMVWDGVFCTNITGNVILSILGGVGCGVKAFYYIIGNDSALDRFYRMGNHVKS